MLCYRRSCCGRSGFVFLLVFVALVFNVDPPVAVAIVAVVIVVFVVFVVFVVLVVVV